MNEGQWNPKIDFMHNATDKLFGRQKAWSVLSYIKKKLFCPEQDKHLKERGLESEKNRFIKQLPRTKIYIRMGYGCIVVWTIEIKIKANDIDLNTLYL